MHTLIEFGFDTYKINYLFKVIINKKKAILHQQDSLLMIISGSEILETNR